jgi:hypothetical protein
MDKSGEEQVPWTGEEPHSLGENYVVVWPDQTLRKLLS